MERRKLILKMIQNRKTATKLLLVQWSRFQNVCMKLEGSTLFTGVNGSGKSTILDAMTYALTGNTQFNKAAKDRDRTVKAYVRGDTKSNGISRYLRAGQVVSYIVMEFYSPIENETLVVGTCIESPDEVSNPNSSWFICKNTKIEDLNLTRIENKKLYVTPKNMIQNKGIRLKANEFMGRDKGTEQVIRALGLRCSVSKYRSKLLKMMAFNPENNIDQFISECVLEPGTVNSLKELREQRNQFDHIKKIYEDLRDGKYKLEEIENHIQEYETRKRNLNIREMMLCYQDLMMKKQEKEDIKYRLQALEQQAAELEHLQKDIDIRFDEARKRLQIAESNDAYRGMQGSIDVLENEIKSLQFEIERNENDTAVLFKLQKLLSDEMNWILDEYKGQIDTSYLLHIAETGYSVDEKRKQLVTFLTLLEEKKERLENDRVHQKDAMSSYKKNIAELEDRIKILNSNQIIYPKEIVQAKQVIKDEFHRRGITTDVRLFAELVQEVKDVSWRKAIETFLGRKRYFLIVDGAYCHTAIEILQEKKIYTATVVITDKVPEAERVKGSAAEQLIIPNRFARNYANYLLNGIHLCDTLEELHEYPKGGLMKNGMLAKSYAVSYMNMKKTDICLGQDAVAIQKKMAIEQQKAIKDDLHDSEALLLQINKQLQSAKMVQTNLSDYHLNAPDQLSEKNEKKKSLKKNIDNIKNNPDFLAVLQEQRDAKYAYDEVDLKRTEISNRKAVCEKSIDQEKEKQKTNSGEIYHYQTAYGEIRTKHLELEQAMKDEYQKLRNRKDDIKVITEKTVQNLRGELDQSEKRLESAQIEYCKISEIDINRRGAGYIGFYHEEYRSIANVKIEEAHSRLVAQSKKLESAFMNDFVAEINETVTAARDEIDSINRELKQIPFGQDTYKFRMEEKPDRMLFFRICKRLENYMNSPEVYMNSLREDEEMERDIQEFMSLILQEEDEEQYTDYRKYFTYDMEISSRQGENEITADLSKKQGSASNGEKQTPYFIILAASLLQCYPKKSCCVRLAFIDEAFSALSRERIEQMVRYFEENDFQVIYAAPPEKISSIGQFISSTVSLVITGRYTNAVEGLVSFDEINSESKTGS